MNKLGFILSLVPDLIKVGLETYREVQGHKPSGKMVVRRIQDDLKRNQAERDRQAMARFGSSGETLPGSGPSQE
jgi:hypothetical protein